VVGATGSSAGPVQSLKISEDEWRLLVDLIAGFDATRYHPVRLDMAMQGLIQSGLLEEVRNGTRVTKLGYRVRADGPRYVPGGPRVWCGVVEPEDPREKPGSDRGGALPA
jgi:hypothetical protein